MVGTVKWFDSDKGFGFITPDDGGKDLFVHHAGTLGKGYDSMAEGDKVSYEVKEQETPKSSRGVGKS